MIKALPESCLNCGTVISEEMTFCPTCGQKNRKAKLPLVVFLSDFFEDYFAVDSKLFRSIGRLVFIPGSLTLEFNSGKRKSYIAPFRMYIFISFIFFFALALNVKRDGFLDDEKIVNFEPDSANLADAKHTIDSLKQSVILSPEDSVDLANLESVILNDSTLNSGGLSLNFGNDSSSTEWQDFFEDQAKKSNENPELFMQTIFRSTSIAMFGMLPFFALILFLFHFKRHRYFVEHLVHSVHIHSFIFVIGLFALAANYFFDWDAYEWILLFAFVYLVLSLRVAYQQTYIRSFIKSVFIFLFYFIFIIIGMLLVVVGSVLLT